MSRVESGRVPGFPFQALVRAVLAEQQDGREWAMTDDDFWCRVTPDDATPRVQGWKLHLSATPLSAPEVLHRAATVLARHGCAFKFVMQAEILEEVTSGRYDRAQCGKFIAAYPRDDDQFRELAELLDRATAGLPGPAILSDRPYRAGGVVYYRYGAFKGVPHLSNEGVQQVRLQAPDGGAVEDLRKPWFCPPTWAQLPLPGPAGRPGKAPAQPKSVLLNGRYVVREAILHSSRGGVYRALDQQTGDDVIVKQARAHVGGTYTGQDARDGLRREAAMLTALSGLGPDLIEVFDQDVHTFLVETVVPGSTLTRWVQEQFSALTERDTGLPWATAARVAAGLAALLADIHGRGLVYRDLSPNNVMVGPDGGLRLIDPEYVAARGTWGQRVHTPGFGAPEYVTTARYGPVPEQEADLYSLGAMLFYLATGIGLATAEDTPTARPALERLELLLTPLSRRNHTVAALAPAIRGLCAEDPAQRWSMPRLQEFLADPPTVCDPHVPAPAPAPLDRLIDDGLSHLLATMTDGDTERLWPSTGFGSTNDPCNVQHGAAGVLGVLTRAAELTGRDDLHTATAQVAAWIDERVDHAPRVLPGLYFGRAGTAWALQEAATLLADDRLAERAADLALALPVRWPNPDLFHGAAGAGLTQLRFWRATGRGQFLDRAVECADGLLACAQRGDDGVFWPVPADFDSDLAGITHLGYAHGVGGVGTFLLDAALATGRADYLDAARQAGVTLSTAAERVDGEARWRTDRHGKPGEGMLYHLCSGASGAGTFLVRLWQATGDAAVLELAQHAAVAVYRTRWFAGSAVCHGLAGNGEFLLDLAEAAGGPYHGWAADLAECLYARHALRDGRMVVPDETGMQVVADYGVGLSGVVAFLLRLRDGGPRLWTPDVAPAGAQLPAAPVAELAGRR